MGHWAQIWAKSHKEHALMGSMPHRQPPLFNEGYLGPFDELRVDIKALLPALVYSDQNIMRLVCVCVCVCVCQTSSTTSKNYSVLDSDAKNLIKPDVD